MKKNQKGFTLIELLVVIAIIGILSSVVLASLNTARSKGTDAAIKANLANARAQAELFYDDHGNEYDDGTFDVCTADDGIAAAVAAADEASSGVAVCNVTAAGWAASAALKTGAFCVDSTGVSTTTAANLTSGSDVTCE